MRIHRPRPVIPGGGSVEDNVEGPTSISIGASWTCPLFLPEWKILVLPFCSGSRDVIKKQMPTGRNGVLSYFKQIQIVCAVAPRLAAKHVQVRSFSLSHRIGLSAQRRPPGRFESLNTLNRSSVPHPSILQRKEGSQYYLLHVLREQNGP